MTNHPIAEQDSLEGLIARLRESAKAYRGMLHDSHANDCDEAADTLSQMRDALLQIESKRPLNIVQARSIARLALTTTKIEKDAQ